MEYEEAVAYIGQIPKFTSKNKPDHTAELLERIGHPERETKVIHVAGTNGKGSVCAFLSSILTRAGYRTGLFTSPHLIKITERFMIDGVPVSEDCFARAFTRVMDVVEGMIADGYAHPTYFELLFAVGLLIFQENQVEFLVLETGLGGRLDATNQVEHPIACVITSIGMDHMQYLGNTVTQIAAEKAGIIKPHVPVIYDGRNPEADAVIAARANDLRSQMFRYDESMIQILGKTDKKIDFLLDYGYDEKIKVTVNSPAFYQIVNSSLALMTLRAIDPDRPISPQTALSAVADTFWPGRMEQVMPGVILDGAHNIDGIRELVRTMRDMGGERLSLLFSAVADKDYREMIRTLCRGVRFSSIVVTEISGTRVVPAARLMEIFQSCTDAPIVAEPDVKKAFALALKARGGGTLFCAGSLYLVGEIKTVLNQGVTYD